MPSFAGGKIEAYAGPTDLGAPDDLEAEIVDFIAGASSSLDVAVQELDSDSIAQAILDARWRGVDVKLVLEQDYLREEGLPKKPPKPEAGESQEQALRRWQWTPGAGGLAENRRITSALLQSSVDVKADFNKAIFHQKFVLRDYRPDDARRGIKQSAALLTGSANFTKTDCHTNLNHLFVFHDRQVCKQYRREFDEISRGEFGRRQHGEVPDTFNLEGVPVKVLFAPDHTPELELIKQILKAERQLNFAIFTFAGSSGIDDALLLAAAADRKVTGVLDPGQAAQRWAAPRGAPGAAPSWLNRENITLFTPKKQGGFRKLHHKLMVVDRHTVIAGSFNYTAPANEYNDENLFVIGSPYEGLPKKEGGPVDKQACTQIADYMRKEIERIVSVSEPWKP
ncbi:MAG: phospholipase D-like domain-containing protein [Actinomycetota bacterium]|nr:phospholipase D-like domain-containing protein [Actinomycetota bacterium]